MLGICQSVLKDVPKTGVLFITGFGGAGVVTTVVRARKRVRIIYWGAVFLKKNSFSHSIAIRISESLIRERGRSSDAD
jgi:hypothetical protein